VTDEGTKEICVEGSDNGCIVIRIGYQIYDVEISLRLNSVKYSRAIRLHRRISDNVHRLRCFRNARGFGI